VKAQHSAILTRNQQRQLDKLAPYVERITSADRVYFEQHPVRKHRLRHASEVEIAQKEILTGEVETLPAGCRHFVIVRKIAPRQQMRLFMMGVEDAETDLEEVDAHGLFDLYFEEPDAHAIFDLYATPEIPEPEAATLRRAALAEKAVRRERSAPFQAERGGRQRAPACAVSARICTSLA